MNYRYADHQQSFLCPALESVHYSLCLGGEHTVGAWWMTGERVSSVISHTHFSLRTIRSVVEKQPYLRESRNVPELPKILKLRNLFLEQILKASENLRTGSLFKNQWNQNSEHGVITSSLYRMSLL